MPIYEYRCENGHSFEAFQSMSDDALEVCEICDAAASRVLSAPAVHFKGSGFYTTDYARKGAKRSAEDGSGSADSKDAKGKDSKDTKSDSSSKGDGGSKSEKAAASTSD